MYDNFHVQICRYAVSDLATLSGLHPYKDKLEIFMKYLYQDSQDILLLDAKNLDLSITTEEDDVMSILDQLDNSHKIAIEKVIQQSKDTAALTSSHGALSLVQDLKSSLIAPKRITGDNLDSESIATISKYISKEIRTGYGTTCEDHGLSIYESATGFNITHRNDQYLLMPVYSGLPHKPPGYHLGPMTSSYVRHKSCDNILTCLSRQIERYTKRLMQHMLNDIFCLQLDLDRLVPEECPLDSVPFAEPEPFAYYFSRPLSSACPPVLCPVLETMLR